MTTQGHLLDLGLRNYEDVWSLQRKLVQLRAGKAVPDTLILVEHPHVFTVGKAVEGEVPSQLEGVPVFRIERGGQWTYHGPGQLVGYPILDLNARQRDIHGFLRGIEEALIQALKKFNIDAERQERQTGVWIRGKKVASIGAAIRNWVSFHGFALNVNTDLTYFGIIVPCGMPSSTMTSMQVLIGSPVDFEEVKNEVRRQFEKAFDVKLVIRSAEAVQSTAIV